MSTRTMFRLAGKLLFLCARRAEVSRSEIYMLGWARRAVLTLSMLVRLGAVCYLLRGVVGTVARATLSSPPSVLVVRTGRAAALPVAALAAWARPA